MGYYIGLIILSTIAFVGAIMAFHEDKWYGVLYCVAFGSILFIFTGTGWGLAVAFFGSAFFVAWGISRESGLKN